MEPLPLWPGLRNVAPWQWLLALTMFVLVGAVTYLFQLHPYLQMRAYLAQAQGVVTQIEPKNHMFVHYRFTADGLPCQGSESEGDFATKLHPGDPLTVYYDARHPSYQSLHQPDSYIAGGVFGVVFTGSMAAFFGLGVSAGLLRELRRSNHALQRTEAASNHHA